ncbi:MAG: hypothetical protein U0793_07680 [Gemmataceae bacterium]
MHDTWEGPIRGSRAWWRGLGQAKAPAEESADAAPAEMAPETAKQGKDKNIRWELVRRIKQEIRDGKYDTPEKWDAALDRLLDRLDDS